MKVLLVDATNNFLRNYAVIPTLDSNGEPNGGTFGFLRSLSIFLHLVDPDEVILVWDGPGGSQKRRTILKDYKAGRKPVRLNRNYEFELENVEQNKVRQRLRLGEYLSNLPVRQMSLPKIEADDVIGYLCHHFKDDEKVIVSNDKDFIQLVSDKVTLYSPTKKDFIDEQKVVTTYNIHPRNFALARAMVGDDTDNIKGIKGIGLKRVVKMFPFIKEKEKVSLDQLFNFCEENGKKYERFLNEKQVIIENHKVMQLETPIVGFSSVQKIRESLDESLAFNATSFRKKLLEDGITTINDGFFQPFRGLYNRRKDSWNK
jgi:DNA polymerase-1